MHAHLARVAPDVLVSHEPELLETGGGLKRALPLLGPGPVFTLNADMVWTGPNPLAALAADWAAGRRRAAGAGAPRRRGRARRRRRLPPRPGDRAAHPPRRRALRRLRLCRRRDHRHRRRSTAFPRRSSRSTASGTGCAPRAGCAASCIRAAGSTSAGPRASRSPRRSWRGDAVSAVRGAAGLRPAARRRLRRGAGRRARRPARRPAARGGGARRDSGSTPAGRSGRWSRPLPRRGPRLLPRIRVVTELADDPLGAGLPPPVPALRRKLELARLIAGLAAAEGELASETAAWDLADSLAELIDEMQGEGVALDAFARIDAGDHAAHWQRSLRFLTLIADYAAAAGPAGVQARMRAAADSLAEAWAAAPPAHPVIVAGSTGSRGATRAFMAAVARLPQGAIVLPGLDAGLPAAVWDRLASGEPGAADHPQHGFRRLAEALGFDPARRAALARGRRPCPGAQRAGVAGAAAGAGDRPVARRGRRAGAAARRGRRWPHLDRGARPEARGAGDRAPAARGRRDRHPRGARHPRPHAGAPGRRRARPLGPDPRRQRRPAAGADAARACCCGWSPPCPGRPLTPEALLALLKHPLVASAPGGRGPHLRLVAPHRDQEAARRTAVGPVGRARRLRPGAKATRRPAWLAWLRAALEPLAAAGRAPLAEHVARHRAAGRGAGGRPRRRRARALGQGRRGRGAGAPRGAGGRGRRRRVRLAAPVPRALPVADRGARRARGGRRRPPRPRDLGHARGAGAGRRPGDPRRPQRGRLAAAARGRPLARPRGSGGSLGLPSPEAPVGLSAHDFQQAAGAREVVLTRAMRDAEAPTVASRWLLRLENLLAGLPPQGPAALAAARARGERWLALADRLAAPAARLPPAASPAPRPPAAARPKRLSVSDVDRLMRDPYAVYARKVLRPLPPRPAGPEGRPADARQRDPRGARRLRRPHASAASAPTPRRCSAPPSARPSTPRRPGRRSTRSGPPG